MNKLLTYSSRDFQIFLCHNLFHVFIQHRFAYQVIFFSLSLSLSVSLICPSVYIIFFLSCVLLSLSLFLFILFFLCLFFPFSNELISVGFPSSNVFPLHLFYWTHLLFICQCKKSRFHQSLLISLQSYLQL